MIVSAAVVSAYGATELEDGLTDAGVNAAGQARARAVAPPRAAQAARGLATAG